MKHPTPDPPELGERDGLSYALFLPQSEPAGGVVVMHGAGSAKESHFDFGRLCRDYDMAAVAYDARGHGRSTGEWGPTAFGDALAMCDLLRDHAPKVALRGSSMGGFTALHAAALDPSVAAVVAICPAPADLLVRGVRSGRITDFAIDASAEGWLGSLDTFDAVRSLGADTSLLLLHAKGDEQVPWTISEELHEAAHGKFLAGMPDTSHRPPKRLLVFPGGHHRSLQHDLEVQNVAARFIKKAFAKK